MSDRRVRSVDGEIALVWAARETGVLDALLESARTPAEVAATADVTDRAARILTEALADRGFFESVDGSYEPTNRALGFLTRRDLRSVGSLSKRVDLFDANRDLPDIAAGVPLAPPEYDTVHRLRGAWAASEARVRAVVTAAVRAVPGADRVVDVGGAPGRHAQEFLARGLETIVCDRPTALDRCRPLLAPTGVDAHACVYDDPDAKLPAGDVVFLAEVIHRLGLDTLETVCSTAADTVTVGPGGTVVVVDHVRGRTPKAATVGVEALATTPAGDTPTEAQYRGALTGAGFDRVAVEDVPGAGLAVVVGRL